VLGFGQDDFITKNTTATVLKTLPNGTYYWRVRAQSLTGSSQSAWSDTQSFTMAWSSTPSPTSPTNGASLVYPQPLLLNWSNVAGAQKYRLTVATDPALGSVLSGYPVDTSATSFSPSARLANGTYYWAVQPIDAEGRAGAQSPIWHFTWNWPTDTSLTVTDLDPSSQVYDPQFSWDPVAGAAKYEIEINSDEGFASGGKVCCSNTTISTSFTPSTLLPADTYYWRVRAIDSSGHAGDWNVYGGATPDTFTIAFDTGSGAITNLHMRDNLSDPGAWSPGYTTQVPIVTWDPVPGAAQYQVNVTPFTGGICDWGASASSQWKSETASTSWTPLGSGYSGAKPYNTSANVASDSPSLDDDPPSAEDVREAAEGLASSEEDLVLLAMYGNEAETLLRSIRQRHSREASLLVGDVDVQRAERIRELVRIVQESGVGEIEIEDEGMRVSVRRADEPGTLVPLPAAGAVDPIVEPAEQAVATVDPGTIRVESPMVGVFYRASQPGGPPFVEIGDVVAAGQTLCVLEAMKLFNELKAEADGRVRSIHADNGQPVEFGTLLFELEPVGAPPAV